MMMTHFKFKWVLVVGMLFVSLCVPFSSPAAAAPHMKPMLFGEFEEDFTLTDGSVYTSPPLASTGQVGLWITISLAAGEQLLFSYQWYNEATNTWQEVSSTTRSGPTDYIVQGLQDLGYESLGVYRVQIHLNSDANKEAHIYGEYMAW
ncbi:hypothetical protein [Paenibacillus campi]|uniref:hypothetical protein n=1 Tax=Paenibacillus campi TaxID=3106031 RepID=UPI002AFDCC98|nr:MULTISPECIES: hypothetical protein [unclassified Paenibacillus]